MQHSNNTTQSARKPAKRKKKKNPGGRPNAVTNDILTKLEAAYAQGLTDINACLYADISPTTLYRYQEKYPEFRERKKVLRENVNMHARLNISNAIKNKKDMITTRWHSEKVLPEYKQKDMRDGFIKVEFINNVSALPDNEQTINIQQVKQVDTESNQADTDQEINTDNPESNLIDTGQIDHNTESDKEDNNDSA